jgi:uncharacterized protein YjbI with pentapeptide repeats
MTSLKPESFYKETFRGLTLAKEELAEKEFEECHFVKCSFIETTLKNCRLVDCSFAESVLSAVKIPNCKFTDCQFTDSKVIGIDWTKARDISYLNFINCQVNYSNFSFLKLTKIKIRYISGLGPVNADYHGVSKLTIGKFTVGDFHGA